MDVRFPLAIGGFLGVAHVVTKLGSFATNLTFGHLITFRSLATGDNGPNNTTNGEFSQPTKRVTCVMESYRAWCQEE